VDGNTASLLDKVLQGAGTGGADIARIDLDKLRFSPCREWDYSKRVKDCRRDDDMAVIFDALDGADAVILASPIFFGSVSAQTKIMIDRFQCAWLDRTERPAGSGKSRRRGAFISVSAGAREDFFKNASSVARNFFATIGAKCSCELFFPGLAEKDDVLKHPDYLEKAFEAGREIIKEWMMADNITVYSTPSCPFCVMVKQFLKDKGIAFSDIDVSSDQAKAQEMVEKSGQMGVPVVDINGRIIVGFDKDAITEALGG